MKKLFSLLLLAMCAVRFVSAQDNFDASAHKADPITYTFDDGKHTVSGYLNGLLEKQTACCGNDAMYLEVEFNTEGKVVNARTLTGKNDCYKQSVVDAVKTITWVATGVKGTKKIYFEVKPLIPCTGEPGENVYVPLNGAPVAQNTNPVTPPKKEEPKKEDVATVNEMEKEMEQMMKESEENFQKAQNQNKNNQPVAKTEPKPEPKKEQPPVAKQEPKKDDWESMYDQVEVKKEEKKTTPPPATKPAPQPAPKPAAPPVAVAKKGEPKVVIPAQLEYKYVTHGERKPDQSNPTSHDNYERPQLGEVRPPSLGTEESEISKRFRMALRQQGICGLAQGLIEVTLDPQGNVVRHNIVKANNGKVEAAIPGVITQMKFTPQPGLRFNYTTYVQFKTDIICEGEKRQPINLDQVPDYITVSQQ